MQQHVRYLVVEDEDDWRTGLKAEIDRYFLKRGLEKDWIIGDTARDADEANTRLKAQKRVDLLTLDMRLDSDRSKSKVSGLQLLGKVAERNQAFFVIVITGAANDPALEKVYKEHAALIRYGLMNEAVKLLPASRVRILNKPQRGSPKAALKALLPHLHSALDQYCAVSRDRYIFRPLARRKGKDTLWQFCFDGGEVKTAVEVQGFEIYRSALHQPNRELKITALINAIGAGSGAYAAVPRLQGAYAIDQAEEAAPRAEGSGKSPNVQGVRGGSDPRAAVQVVDPRELKGMTILDGAGPNVVTGDIDPELIIRAILAARRSGDNVDRLLNGFAEAYGLWLVKSVPSRIRYYLMRENSKAAGNEFHGAIRHGGSTRTALEEVLEEVEPVIQRLAENSSANVRHANPAPGTPKAKVRSGSDTKELVRARKQRDRAMDELRSLGLTDMVAHFEEYMKEGEDLRGRICYKFKEDEFPLFWLTE